MPKNDITIMFVENDKRLLQRRKKWLEDQGYAVITAYKYEEAKQILRGNAPIDLAIIDVRLSNNDDEEDESGFFLARQTTDAKIPTLIYTLFPNYEFVRRAQTWFPDGTPAHVNFLGKREGKQHNHRDVFLDVVRGAIRGRNVFIVHGHDNIKDTVKLFVKERDLEPIVLEDQPNAGKTIIEKFEHYGNVDFVVVIVTPDDIGKLETEPSDEMTFRARQNVIFELGYFIGKYSRLKVAILLDKSKQDEPIELPSDIAGLAYIPMGDNKDWQIALVREMRTSGLHIDNW